MRRRERRRGAKVTGDADTEDVESKKTLAGVGRWVLVPSRQQSLLRYWRAVGNTPGSEVVSSLTLRLRDNQGNPTVGAHGVRAEPKCQFNALMGLMYDPEGLHASFERQAGKKAPGVYGIRKICIPNRRGRLRLGAEWCNAPCSVL